MRTQKKKVIVGRPINGISINGLEYLLDAENIEIKFDSVEDAKAFLSQNGIYDTEGFIFEEINVYVILTDIGVKLELSEGELIAATESELHFLTEDKEYSISDITVVQLCEDISGHTGDLNEELFPMDARDVVEKTLNNRKLAIH